MMTAVATPTPGSRLRPRALIVEDYRALGDALDAALTAVGCDVVRAGTLAAGLALLVAEPDFLILDLVLPDGSGADVLRAVRTRNLRTKVAVMTALDDPDTLAPVLELRPEALRLKPTDVADLLRALGLPA